MEYFSP